MLWWVMYRGSLLDVAGDSAAPVDGQIAADLSK
jgi:hypothetical protein